jgi:hypothetical protein
VSGRRQGILPFVYKNSKGEDVTARAGLPLVVETFRALGLDVAAAEELPAPKRQRGFGPERKLEALTMLIAAGGERVEDIGILADDKGFVKLLDESLPSPDALLDMLNSFHDEALVNKRPEDVKAFVPEESAALKGLENVNRRLVAAAAPADATVATIDHDGTIIESHKRGLTMAYEGSRGYQPLVAVWAEQQLIVADEFRDANVPGGMDPLSSARRAFENLPKSVTQRYFRADSASYYEPLLKYLYAEGIRFSISADMTTQLRQAIEAVPAEVWQLHETRAHETVELADVEFTPGDWPKEADPLRYVALRFTPTQEELFEGRAVRHLAVVTNRRELSLSEVVEWHWQKAGTIEHVHRVMKDELAAACMPCKRFGANAAWFRINALTFNLLTALKRIALPERLRRARPRRLRFETFAVAARLVHHQSQTHVLMSASDERLQELVDARVRLHSFMTR